VGGLEEGRTSAAHCLNPPHPPRYILVHTFICTRLPVLSFPPQVVTPAYHAPWKLSSVISGHLGWVRSIAVDPLNQFLVTGSSDRTIKLWSLPKLSTAAPDSLLLTLTGHINAVRGLAVSERHPYMFSAGEDKMVKCWDLETNRVIRDYHGHLSGVFALTLHPTLDILITGGRDSVARVWDMRTKNQIHCLSGHEGAIGAIQTNTTDPQVRPRGGRGE